MTNDYTRNRIRNELIPHLEKKYNPSIKQALRRYAELAELDDALLNEIAITSMDGNISFEHNPERILLDIGEIRNNPVSINTRIAGFVLQTLRLDKFATFELITQLTQLMYSDNPSGSVDLPLGSRAYREYDTIIFTDADEDRKIEPDPTLRMMPQVIMKKDYHPDEEYMYAAFDFDLFNEEHPGKVGELKLRTRQEGDYLPMKNGSKKIQDLLVDSKVKRSARDSILMVAIGNEILWVLPSRYFAGRQESEMGRFSPKYHISDETERVLFIEIVDDI
jgi:tRNA(Ile)-lysidine synthase